MKFSIIKFLFSIGIAIYLPKYIVVSAVMLKKMHDFYA